MGSLSLAYKNACYERTWYGFKAIQGKDYCVRGDRCYVVYSAALALGQSEILTGFTIGTNFVSNGSTGARTVTCYLYTSDPSGNSTPPAGYIASVTLNNKYFTGNGEFVTFTFTGLTVNTSGTLYLWMDNVMSANPGNDQIYHYATGNAYTQTPAISNAVFALTELTSLSVTTASVTTGGNQVVTIGNGAGRSVTVEVKYGNTVLYTGTTTTGTLTIPVSKTWFDTAGLTAVQSFTAAVEAYTAGTVGRVYSSFTVVAGDDMRPSVATPTVSLVQTGNAATYFPSTYIAANSRAKVEAAVTLPSNAGVYSATVVYQGGSAAMTYNSTTQKYEATTPALNASTAFTVIITDQRGLSGSNASASVTVIPYTPPSVTVDSDNTYRCSSDGTKSTGGAYYKAKAAATWYSALSGNALLEFDVRLYGEVSGNALTSGVQSGVLGGSMSPTNNYTLVFTIQDKVSEPVTRSFVLKSIARDVVLKRSGTGTNVGVGTTPTSYNNKSTVQLPDDGRFLLGSIPVTAFALVLGNVGPDGAFDYTGDSFGKDFINVDFEDFTAEENAAAVFLIPPDGTGTSQDYSYWSNVPPPIATVGWWSGLRIVTHLTDDDATIFLFEFNPVPGRIWSRRITSYNVDSGWYVTTPTQV